MKSVIVLLPCYLFVIVYIICAMIVGSNTEPIFLCQNMALHTLLYIAAIMDINKREISNILIMAGIATGLIFTVIRGIIYGPWSIIIRLASSIVIFVMLFIFIIITRRAGSLGGGDAKLFAVIGLFCGMEQTMICILLSSVFGLVLFGLLRILRKPQRSIPLAPAIMMAGMVIEVIIDGKF